MFEFIPPKKFCREYFELKGGYSSQLLIFMAVVLGLKPFMDDTIRFKEIDKFRNICRKYKLYFKFGAACRNFGDPKIKEAVGGETLTTTKAFGLPPSHARPNDDFFVFISRTRKNLLKGFKNGWYPLVIKDRVISRPYIDCIKYGHNLGYPDCCVDFFYQRNNWSEYSHLFEVYKNTPKNPKPSFLLNPFSRYGYYSYLTHIPCSFNCEKTVAWTKKIRLAIYRREPELIKNVDENLKRPVLVFYENKAYGFDGYVKNNRLFYKEVKFLSTESQLDQYGKILKSGNNLICKNGENVKIYKNSDLFKIIKKKPNQWAPEFPFLISKWAI